MSYTWEPTPLRKAVTPRWTLVKALRRYTNRLTAHYDLPSPLTPLKFSLDAPPSSTPRCIATTFLFINRHWNDETGEDTGWTLKLSWILYLHRLDMYVDPLAVGKECIRHELAHVMHAPERLSYLKNFSRAEGLTKWDELRTDPVHGEHGSGWREWCHRIGCDALPNIDNRRFPLKSPAMAWA